MKQQSLTVPWRELSDACAHLTKSRSFAIWASAIARAERRIPAWLALKIESCCPGFLSTRRQADDAANLQTDMERWIDHHLFPSAVDGGWFEALDYYAARSREMQAVRSFNPWSDPQERYPEFESWYTQETATISSRPSAVAQYVEWDALACWVRLLASPEGRIPETAEKELERRCPGFLGSISGHNPTRPSYSMWCWEQLLQWVEQHHFAEAVQGSWLQSLRDAAREHLRDQRINAYWADCDVRWRHRRPATFPSFDEWLAAADAYVELQA